jgi:hypothetical protein
LLTSFQAFKHNTEYRLEQFADPRETKEPKTIGNWRTGSRPTFSDTPFNASRGGTNTIFVGNIPMTMSLNKFRELFAEHGTIRNVELSSKVAILGKQIESCNTYLTSGSY